MKLFFSWEKSADSLHPSCSSNVVNQVGVSPLACLLTDDGGQRYLDTVPWLNEGIERAKLIRHSGINTVDWSRDAWGAELSREQAKIYSLYEDDCFETLNLDAFETALLAWRNFIQMTPDPGASQMIEI
ncbi:MAG: hypothetical protein JNK17_08445 [Hydrogenophaga sp.]|nr:hypothetical protein [Hydrogenophaga sp.]